MAERMSIEDLRTLSDLLEKYSSTLRPDTLASGALEETAIIVKKEIIDRTPAADFAAELLSYCWVNAQKIDVRFCDASGDIIRSIPLSEYNGAGAIQHVLGWYRRRELPKLRSQTR